MDLLLPLFQLLYFIAHFFVSLLVSGYNTFCDIQQTTRHLYQWILGKTDSEIEFFNSLRSKSVKVPSHPALVLLPGQFNSSNNKITELCKALTYLIQTGASYVSAYDAAGLIFDQRILVKETLEDMLPSTKILLSGAEVQRENNSQNSYVRQRDFSRYGDLKNESSSLNYKDNANTRKVILNIQSYESGTRSIIDTVQNLSEIPANELNETSVNDVHDLLTSKMYNRKILDGMGHDDKERLDGVVNKRSSIPDPDLIIVIGEHLSSNGFPSWYLRLSEFVLIPSLFRLDILQLQKIMTNFTRKEQRFGR